MNFNSLLIKIVTICLTALIFAISGCGGGSNQSTPIVSNNTGTFSGTLSGTIRYQDKEYDTTGFNCPACSNPYKTVRYAVVEVVDSASNRVLFSGTTGSNGSYTSPYSGAGATIYVRVLAEVEINNTSLVRVRDLGGSTYAVGSGSISSGGTTTANFDINLATYSQVSGAFNILDVLTSGMQFVKSLAGVYPTQQLSAFWEYDSAFGTFYCSGNCDTYTGAGIYIIGNDSGDTDGYDDDVILHEFGHFIANEFSRDDSPGGLHYLGQNDEDLRLSWSEGWGDFMPLAVRRWQSVNDPARISSVDSSPSVYVDTNDNVSPPINFYIDLGNPLNNDITGWLCATKDECFSYSSNELAVANLLWNLMTGPTGSFGMQPIWDDFSQVLPNLSTYLPNDTLVNLETFWDGWLNRRGTGDLSTLWTIYGYRHIYCQEDTYEDDSSFGAAKPITEGVANAQTHYLYRASGLDDSDFYVFTPSSTKQYTVSTSNLSNGADTFVMVYNSGHNEIISNDNFNNISYTSGLILPSNDALTLSSSASFSATLGMTYYLEVKPSPNRPISAGRYGTYTITVQ